MGAVCLAVWVLCTVWPVCATVQQGLSVRLSSRASLYSRTCLYNCPAGSVCMPVHLSATATIFDLAAVSPRFLFYFFAWLWKQKAIILQVYLIPIEAALILFRNQSYKFKQDSRFWSYYLNILDILSADNIWTFYLRWTMERESPCPHLIVIFHIICAQ